MLVMYYNKDILNQAKMAKQPETWQEFIDSFKQLVAVDSNGDFLQMAAGLGAPCRSLRQCAALVSDQHERSAREGSGEPTGQQFPIVELLGLAHKLDRDGAVAELRPVGSVSMRVQVAAGRRDCERMNQREGERGHNGS